MRALELQERCLRPVQAEAIRAEVGERLFRCGFDGLGLESE